MAASMGGAWKAYLESLGTGVPWFRDGKPVDRDEDRWGVVQEGVGYAHELHGDDADPGAHVGVSEVVQLDLWQKARGPVAGGRAPVLEDYALPDVLDAAIRLPQRLQTFAPWRVYGVTGVTRQRWPISNNLLRTTWSVTVRRDSGRIPT